MTTTQTTSFHKSNLGQFGESLPADMNGYVHLTADAWLAAPVDMPAADRADAEYMREWAESQAEATREAVAAAEESLRQWQGELSESDRETLVAEVMSANLTNPEIVCDFVLDAASTGGIEAGRAELAKAVANEHLHTYDINTECGPMNDIRAASVEEAKQIYASAHSNYDFDGAEAGEYPGSWFFVNEDGVRIEDFTDDMPN